MAGTLIATTVAAAAVATLSRFESRAIRSRRASTPNPIQIENA
jgi:hypothetical protein